jgi:hypothetical protein
VAHYGVDPRSRFCEAPKQVPMLDTTCLQSLDRVIRSHLERASIHRRDL